MSSVFKPESQYRAFIISLVTFGLSYGLYKAIIDNYLAEIVNMTQFDRGVSEFFRELPGFLLVFVLQMKVLLCRKKCGLLPVKKGIRKQTARW